MRLLLVLLAGFVALTAVGGGVAMATGVDRKVDPAWLEGTPFRSYRLPGALLALLVGGSAAAAAVSAGMSTGAASVLAVTAGAVLAGWIAVEIVVLNQPSAPTWIEVMYFVMGAAMIVLGLAL